MLHKWLVPFPSCNMTTQATIALDFIHYDGSIKHDGGGSGSVLLSEDMAVIYCWNQPKLGKTQTPCRFKNPVSITCSTRGICICLHFLSYAVPCEANIPYPWLDSQVYFNTRQRSTSAWNLAVSLCHIATARAILILCCSRVCYWVDMLVEQ